MATPSLQDHFSPSGSEPTEGIYRVVGTNDQGATLLKVGNAEGQRVSTGEIMTVSYDDLDEFEPAENPDGNRPLGDAVRSNAEMIYWSLRVFVQQLVAHQLLTLLAIVVIMVGSFGKEIVSLPDGLFSVLVLLGSLGLAYIGSGRL